MIKQLRFDGRVAVITGAGSGLGRSHALALAQRGASVIAVARAASRSSADEVCAEIESTGGTATAVTATVGDEADAQHVVGCAIERYGRIDALVHCAGDAKDQHLASEAPGEPFERMMATHVVGPLQINRAAWPHLARQGYGRILFTGSSNATGWMKGPIGYEVDYAAAKAALIAVTRQTAGEGGAHGITANLLLPWAFTKGVARRIGDSPLGDWMRTNLPANLVSAVVAVLVHEDCPATGEMISAEGGRVARVFFAATRGYFDPALTPEGVLENWGTIEGSVDAQGHLLDAFEQTQPREQRLITEMARARRLPSLVWISGQSLREMNLDSGAAGRPAPE